MNSMSTVPLTLMAVTALSLVVWSVQPAGIAVVKSLAVKTRGVGAPAEEPGDDDAEGPDELLQAESADAVNAAIKTACQDGRFKCGRTSCAAMRIPSRG